MISVPIHTSSTKHQNYKAHFNNKLTFVITPFIILLSLELVDIFFNRVLYRNHHHQLVAYVSENVYIIIFIINQLKVNLNLLFLSRSYCVLTVDGFDINNIVNRRVVFWVETVFWKN